MSKSVDAFRTISEVADVLDVQKHVLRFWEVKFPQIRPMKRGGGRRYYRPEDMVLLRGIQHLLHAEGYTIKGVQKILREQGVEQVKVHGLAATALAESIAAGKAAAGKAAAGKSAAGKSKTPAPVAPVASAGRVRALPKSEKASPEAKPSFTVAHRTAIETALRELQTCRDTLMKASAVSSSAKSTQPHLTKPTRASR
ncbi:MAG: MerR family transcriptional regulator [Hyphomicrobiaceae bacterium]